MGNLTSQKQRWAVEFMHDFVENANKLQSIHIFEFAVLQKGAKTVVLIGEAHVLRERQFKRRRRTIAELYKQLLEECEVPLDMFFEADWQYRERYSDPASSEDETISERVLRLWLEKHDPDWFRDVGTLNYFRRIAKLTQRKAECEQIRVFSGDIRNVASEPSPELRPIENRNFIERSLDRVEIKINKVLDRYQQKGGDLVAANKLRLLFEQSVRIQRDDIALNKIANNLRKGPKGALMCNLTEFGRASYQGDVIKSNADCLLELTNIYALAKMLRGDTANLVAWYGGVAHTWWMKKFLEETGFEVMNFDGFWQKRTRPRPKPKARRPCRRNQIRNPLTGRCVSRTGIRGREILKPKAKPKRKPKRKPKPKPKSSVLNPKTNRCNKRTSKNRRKKPCRVIRNPSTNRCVKRTGKIGRKILKKIKINQLI